MCAVKVFLRIEIHPYKALKLRPAFVIRFGFSIALLGLFSMHP